MPGNIYEFNIYPNLRCPSIVQARIRLKSKSQHFSSSSRSSSTYPFDAQIYEQPLFMPPQIELPHHHNNNNTNTHNNNNNNNNSSNNYLNQSQNQYVNYTNSNRRPQSQKPVYPSLLRYRSQNQYLDQTESPSNLYKNQNQRQQQRQQQQRQEQQRQEQRQQEQQYQQQQQQQQKQQSSNGINLPIDLPPHYQNPQVSTHKIYVQNMTPPPTHLQNEITKSCEDYSFMDGNKSYTTFSTSPITKSERERQNVAYHSEFTVKGKIITGAPNSGLSNDFNGYNSASQMAKSYSSMPTNPSMPGAFQNQSSINFGIYQTPVSAKSYSNFSCVPDEPPQYNFQQCYDDYQVDFDNTSTSNQDLMAKSYSAIPGTYQQQQSANSYYQNYQQQQQQQQLQSPSIFNSPMAKSYSNFSQPVTPLFDASSILRCYSSAAIMQQPNPMTPTMTMTPLTSLPPLTPMPPMTPMTPPPQPPMTPPMTPYDSSTMHMYYQPQTPSTMQYMSTPQPPQHHHQPQQYPSCQPCPTTPMPLPILPLGAQAPPSIQKYEFADFQPDLCCIGRHLKRLRDRYRSQFVLRIN